MKKMEEKWKKRVDALDGEYFAFKSIVTDKKESLEVLEKEAKSWENKSGYFRDENAVATDRLRVSSIAISPQKRKEMQTLLEESRRRGKGVDPKQTKSRTKIDRSRSKK